MRDALLHMPPTIAGKWNLWFMNVAQQFLK